MVYCTVLQHAVLHITVARCAVLYSSILTIGHEFTVLYNSTLTTVQQLALLYCDTVHCTVQQHGVGDYTYCIVTGVHVPCTACFPVHQMRIARHLQAL